MVRRIISRLFVARPTVARQTNVRRLDGQFIIVVREYDGLIDYRYENDRLNNVYTCLSDYAS